MSRPIYLTFTLLSLIFSSILFSGPKTIIRYEFDKKFLDDVAETQAIIKASSSWLLRDQLKHIFVTYKEKPGGQLEFETGFVDPEKAVSKEKLKELNIVMHEWLAGVVLASHSKHGEPFTLFRMQEIGGQLYFVNYIKPQLGSNLPDIRAKLVDNGSTFLARQRAFYFLATDPSARKFAGRNLLGSLTKQEAKEVRQRYQDIAKMGHLTDKERLKIACEEITLSTGKLYTTRTVYVVGSQAPSDFIKRGAKNGGLVLRKIENFNLKGYNPQLVTAWDYNKNEITHKPVIRKYTSHGINLLFVYLKGKNEPIKTTPNHPFYVDGKGWTAAEKLTSKDTLVHTDGTRISVARTELVELKKSIDVVNLEIEEFNNFFVQAGENGKFALVHNCELEELDPDTPDNKETPKGEVLGQKEISLINHICFPENTFLRVEEGGYKLISEIKEGDSILSCNDDESVCHYRKVLEVMESQAKDFVDIRTPSMGDYPLQATANHPFYLADENRYKMAILLQPGEVLQYESYNDRNAREEIEEVDYTTTKEPVTVYNLKVEEFENYYVAPATGDLSHPKRFYKVHNCSLGLDFTPVVGEVKGAVEALFGKNYMTHEELSKGDRFIAGIGAIPFAGKLLKGVAKLIRSEKKIANSAQVAAKLEKAALEAEKRGVRGAGGASSKKVSIDDKKFDYIFGKSTGHKNANHNKPRSNQNAAQMNRLGINDTPSGRTLLKEHFEQVLKSDKNIINKYTDKHGTFEVRESLFAGPSGKFSKFETSWQVMSDGTRRFISIIPKSGKM